MLKAIAVLVLCLLSITTSHAQNIDSQFKVELGQVFRADKRSVPLDIIGHDSSGYYILYGAGTHGQREKAITKFNLDLVPTEQTLNLASTVEGEEISTLGITQIDNTIYHISAVSSRQSATIFSEKINLNDFTLGERKAIIKINDFGKQKNPFQKFIISNDTSVFFYTIPNKANGRKKAKVLLLDEKFNIISTEEYEFPYQEKLFSITKIILGDNDEIYLLGQYNFGTNSLKTYKLKKYEYILFNLSNGKATEITKISNGGKHLIKFDFLKTKQNELVLAGFYSEKDIFAIKGTFYEKINLASKQNISRRFQEFDSSFYTQLAVGSKKDFIVRRIKKGRYEDPNYVLYNTFQTNDGGIILVAEQTIFNGYTYGTKNLALVKLTLDGTIEWTKKIGKNNANSNTTVYSHYNVIKRNSKLLFFYNDNAKNLHHIKGSVYNAFMDLGAEVLMLTSVTFDGEYKRKIVIQEGVSEGIRIRPQLSRLLDENTILFFGQSPLNLKKQRFVKIKLL